MPAVHPVRRAVLSSVSSSASVNSGMEAFQPRVAADLQRRGELVKIACNGVALKRERHRVMGIAHQQIERRTQLRSDEITRSIDADAVADVEQPFDLTLTRGGRRHQMLREQARRELQSFDTRPIRRSRQPSSCVMSSAAYPPKARPMTAPVAPALRVVASRETAASWTCRCSPTTARQ